MKKSIKKPNNKRLIIIFGVIIFAIIFYLGYVYLLNGSQLFSPTAAGLSIASALFLSFILGLVHGATPDEHTWPITFSYAVGAMTTRNGAKAGLLFSAGFTFQRALMSELAFLVLAPFLRATSINGIIYLIVGSVMAISGFYVLRRGLYPHLHAISHA